MEREMKIYLGIGVVVLILCSTLIALIASPTGFFRGNVFRGNSQVKSVTMMSDCYDSDGGNEKTVYGYVTYNNETTYDYCLSDDTICELVCIDGSPACVADTSCPTDYICDSGVCVEVANETHTECSGGSCIDVSGNGTDECTTNIDCRHKECNATGSCITLMTPGDDECQVDANCTLPTHNECSDGYCIEVNSSGEDQCASDNQCRHKECQGNDCIIIMTPGTDECEFDANCSGWCYDSDGGQNYFVKGYTNSSQGSYWDYCATGEMLFEYYCIDNSLASDIIECSDEFNETFYCVNGACSFNGTA